jgi:hypothetical protein
MAAGDDYRAKTLELLDRAGIETDPVIRADMENLAAAYLRLAEQAERNEAFTIGLEIPPDDP